MEEKPKFYQLIISNKIQNTKKKTQNCIANTQLKPN